MRKPFRLLSQFGIDCVNSRGHNFSMARFLGLTRPLSSVFSIGSVVYFKQRNSCYPRDTTSFAYFKSLSISWHRYAKHNLPEKYYPELLWPFLQSHEHHVLEVRLGTSWRWAKNSFIYFVPYLYFLSAAKMYVNRYGSTSIISDVSFI